jgi:hypothetical protein
MVELEPLAVDPEGDLIRANFDYGVVRSVETVGGCVRAEQGSPGGPEFGVKFSFQEYLRAEAHFLARFWHGRSRTLKQNVNG